MLKFLSMKSRRPLSPRILTRSIAALVFAGSISAAHSANNVWIGGTSADYNDPSNWSLNHVPDAAAGDSLDIQTTPANVATITIDEPQVVDIRIGETNTAGAIGTLFHTGGTLASGAGNWTAIGAGTPTSTGIYNLTSKTADAGNLSGYTQGNGRLNTNGRLYVGGTDDTGGYGAGGVGFININSTNGVFGTDRIYVGARAATGTVNLVSGSFTTTGDRAFIGQGAGGTGTVNVSGGSFTLPNNGRIHVGDNGGQGFLNVSGTGSVSSANDMVIGAFGGTGVVNQTGGTINSGGWTYLGGAYEGSNNTGTLNVSGGSYDANAQRINVGVGNGATGHLTVSGTGIVRNTGQFNIGASNGVATTSTVDVSGSGLLTTNVLIVGGQVDNDGFNAGATGKLTVTGPNAIVTATGDVVVGNRDNNTGQLLLEGGTVNVGNTLFIGASGNSLGTATVNSGALNLANQLQIGTYTANAQGVLNINGGSVTGQGWMVIGHAGTGTVNISGGALVKGNVNGGELNIGEQGTGRGRINQTGGSVISLTQQTNVGRDVNSIGHWEMSGGVATLANTVLGASGNANGFATGIWNVSGTAKVTVNILTIGQSGGHGTLTINSDRASVTSSDQIFVGNGAGGDGVATVGVLNVSAGTISSNSWFGIGREGSTGTLNISGTGVVNQGVGDTGSRLELTNAGQPTTGTVNLNGGILTTNGIINGAGGITNLYLNGGLLKPRIDNGNFIAGLTSATVKAGGARIDTDGHNITINQALVADPVSTGGGLTKSGAGQLALTAVETYTGVTRVNQGKLSLSDTAKIATGSGIFINGGRGVTVRAIVDQTVLPGAVLSIDNGGNGSSNALGTQPVTLNGGTLEYHGGASSNGGLFVPELYVASGGAVASQPQGGGFLSGLVGIDNLLTNPSGTSTLAFISTYGALGENGNGSDTGHILVNAVNSSSLSTVIATNNGIIGGWATVRSASFNGGDPATHFATNGGAGITAVTYSNATLETAAATDNIRTTGGAVTASKTVNALESTDGDVTIDGGQTLTLATGGLIFNGTDHWVRDGAGGGSLTAGALGGYKVFATVNDAATNFRIHNVSVINNAGNAVGFVKGGIGTLNLESDNSFTGPTVVNSGTLILSGSIGGTNGVTVNDGATFRFGVAGDKINNAAPVTLASGSTFNTGGFSEGPLGGASGAAAAMGTLTLGGDTTIDFGTGLTGAGSSLLFAGLDYTAGNTVSIRNWTGLAGIDLGSAANDRLLFSTASFTNSQLAAFQFYGDDGTPFAAGAAQISFNGYSEIVPVPEPSAALLASLTLSLLGLRRRRRVA